MWCFCIVYSLISHLFSKPGWEAPPSALARCVLLSLITSSASHQVRSIISPSVPCSSVYLNPHCCVFFIACWAVAVTHLLLASRSSLKFCWLGAVILFGLAVGAPLVSPAACGACELQFQAALFHFSLPSFDPSSVVMAEQLDESLEGRTAKKKGKKKKQGSAKLISL